MTSIPRTISLEQMVRKRHDGPAWVVVEEVANSTGSNVKRHADMVALGIWPSHGYAIHGYEVKRSRGDVQRELGDPTKADAVGKYCDYWWLVCSSEEIISGLTIPETWGVLVPRGVVLRVVRKAPKREATPVGRAFIAALARKVVADWVPKHEHEALKAKSVDAAKAELEQQRQWRKDDVDRELKDLQARVAAFEEDSGVKIGQPWEGRNIAKAVAAVMKARDEVRSRHFIGDEAANLARRELHSIRESIKRHERSAIGLEEAALRVEKLVAELEAEAIEPTAAERAAAEDPNMLPLVG